MRLIDGSRGRFYGCSRYREGCRGTRPFEAQVAIATPQAAPPTPRGAVRPPPAAVPTGPGDDLITELRRATGHLGAAIDLLQRLKPRLDVLLIIAARSGEDPDGTPF